jgi:protein involved in polysaccharide export with SLBB domain
MAITVRKSSFARFAAAGPIALAAAGLLSMPGCAAKQTDMLHFLKEREYEVSAIEYRVGIPDGIDISSPRVAEIDGQSRRIQPDGKINLDLIGEVKVVGMTAKELAAKLEVLLSRYYLDPQVSVRVAGYYSKKYYMYGQVGAQGPHPYTGRDTLLDAVLRAGVNYTSWTSRTKVIRPSRGDTPIRVMEVNLDRMIENGDWSRNILLEPDDIVCVPPTPFAWVGQQIRQLLLPADPVLQAYRTPKEFMDASDTYNEK